TLFIIITFPTRRSSYLVLINVAARKGYTKFIESSASIPKDVRTGVQKDVDKQEPIGKETTNAASIDSVGFHLALILMVSGLAFRSEEHTSELQYVAISY